jgi:hypothetical protein
MNCKEGLNVAYRGIEKYRFVERLRLARLTLDRWASSLGAMNGVGSLRWMQCMASGYWRRVQRPMGQAKAIEVDRCLFLTIGEGVLEQGRRWFAWAGRATLSEQNSSKPLRVAGKRDWEVGVSFLSAVGHRTSKRCGFNVACWPLQRLVQPFKERLPKDCSERPVV